MVKPQSMVVLIGALLATLTVGAKEVAAAQSARGTQPRFSVVEAGIADMQKAMRDGRVTSRDLVLQYLTRIATYEDKLNAAMTVNPRALQEAEALDRARARQIARPAAWHPDRAQRQHPHDRHADHRRCARV